MEFDQREDVESVNKYVRTRDEKDGQATQADLRSLIPDP